MEHGQVVGERSVVGSSRGVRRERDVERGLEGDDKARATEAVQARKCLLHAERVGLGEWVVAKDEELVDELDAGRQDLSEVSVTRL